MKIIITENQNALLRRYEQIKDEVNNNLKVSDPCFYKNYRSFDQYLKAVVWDAVNKIVGPRSRNIRMNIDPVLIMNFKNDLVVELRDTVQNHYDNYIKQYCPNIDENNNN